MNDRPSKSGRRAGRALPSSAWGSTAALALAVACGVGLAPPAGAAETEGAAGDATSATENEAGVVGREALIGRLIPITGDPIETRSVDLRIEFRINSAELNVAAMAQLLELGEALVSEALQGAALGVYGHTDTSGRAEYNQALSERRAQAVAGFLSEHFGIEPPRFREVRGYGEERLREDLPPDAPAQRRVEIVTFHELASDGAGDSPAEVPVSDAPWQSGGMTREPVGGDDDVVHVRRDGEAAADEAEEDRAGESGTEDYIIIQ